MSTLATVVVTVLLGSAGVASVARVVRRGTVADRTVGLDLLVIVLAAAITADAARTGRTVYLPIVSVVALLAFVATVTIGRFIESAGPVDPVPDPEEGDRP